MKVEAVIFDWAGTTVDYGCFAPVQTFMALFKESGIDVTMQQTRKPMGMLKWDHIKTMLEMPVIHNQWLKIRNRDFTDHDIDQMHDRFTDMLMKVLNDYTDIKPYVIETMQWLRNQQIKIGSTTGYTDTMMNVVTKAAQEKGYSPDCWVSPNSVSNMGRPYPYMIFKNMELLGLSDVHNIIKVGDTISDIQEGIHAGVISVGILEGSSLMGLTKDEYTSLDEHQRQALLKKCTAEYKNAGADYVLLNLSELPALIEQLN